MADRTPIGWTDATWNPITGCAKVSPGCDNCYAESFSERFRGVPGHYFEQGFDLVLRPDRLHIPLRWTRPRMIFVNSMSDLFHADVPFDFIDRIFDVMEQTPRHVYQVLTKRSGRLKRYVSHRFGTISGGCPGNIWIGVSVESVSFVRRIDHLRATNAAVRFISFEPLLGPIRHPDLRRIDWVIAGGESGNNARVMKPEWVRFIRNACIRNSIPFFFKQWGGRFSTSGGNKLDGRVWQEFPAR